MRWSPVVNAAILSPALGSSDRISTGRWPVTCSTIAAYSRASSWSLASTRPAASGTPLSRRWVMRSSMAAMTCGTQRPFGFSAVRHAVASVRFVPASVSEAAMTSPALFRHRDGARVRREHDGADDAVGERFAVAVA